MIDSEEAAARAALTGNAFERVALSVRAVRAIVKNPDDIRPVFILGLAANAGRFLQFLGRFAATDEGRALLHDRPTIDGAAVAELRKLPKGTLGRAYADYLDDNGLDADLFRAPPGLPPDAQYLAQRLRQTHDVWHVLTGYRPDVAGEVALQAFTFAQTRMPSAGLIAAAGTARWAFRARGLAKMTLDGYRRGKRAQFLASVRWEDRWTRSVDEVRREFGITPATAKEVAATSAMLRAA